MPCPDRRSGRNAGVSPQVPTSGSRGRSSRDYGLLEDRSLSLTTESAISTGFGMFPGDLASDYLTRVADVGLLDGWELYIADGRVECKEARAPGAISEALG